MIDYREFLEISARRVNATEVPFSVDEKVLAQERFKVYLKKEVYPVLGEDSVEITQEFVTARRRVQEDVGVNLSRALLTASVLANALSTPSLENAIEALVQGDNRAFAAKYDYAYGVDLALSPLFTGIFGIRGRMAVYEDPSFFRFIFVQMVSHHELQGITYRKSAEIVQIVMSESPIHRDSPVTLTHHPSGEVLIKQMLARIEEYKTFGQSDVILPPYLEKDFVSLGASSALELYSYLYPLSQERE